MLPVIHVDVLFFGGVMIFSLIIGYLVASRRVRGDVASKTFVAEDLNSKGLIQLMSRSDHLMDNYASSILGNISAVNISAVEEDLSVNRERWAHARDNILRAAESIIRQIRRLRLVRLGLDPNAIRLSPVNLGRLIPNVLALLEPLASEKDVTLLMEQRRAVPPVLGDPDMLEEVFMTLIDNAIKHNRPKTKIMAEIDSSDEGATIRISDNGDGMKPENLSRIFDIGVREGGAGAPAGSGMGLHIAKLLTELQGGDISVESKLGQGSVFTVKLPIAS